MSSSAPPAPATPRRSLLGRPVDDGPRASFSQLMPYLLEHRAVLSWVIVISVLGAGASLAQPLLVAQVISTVEEGGELGALVALLVGLVVLAGLLSGFGHYLLQRTGEGVVLSSRRTLVRRLLHLPISEFDQRRTGDLVSRVGSDTTLLRAVLTQGLVEAIGGSLTFLGALVAMIIIDPVLLLLTVLVIAVSVVTVVLLSARIRVASRKAQEKVGDLAAAVERAISSVRTVRAANATEREIATIHEDARGAWLQGIKVAKISALVVPISSIALQISFLVVLGVGGYRVAAGDIEIAELVAFILFLFLLIGPLGQAFGAITSVNSALGALGRIQEIIALPSEAEGDADVAPAAATGDRAAIAFDDVHFRYPEAARKTEQEKVIAEVVGEETRNDTTVLRGVTFAVPQGSRTALVGPSGAGKSTILSLIERFYDPTSGVIRMEGVDIRALDRLELRSRIGYVEQDAPVLAGTLRDNLLLGSPTASDDDCVAVLERVNLLEVLQRSDEGLDAQVGESGVMLSGGERQRLAIARALLAAPPILLLDESTSSLDGVNERLMREAIDAVSADRTLIVIAHRLSTVVDSDQIVVLEHGRVIGTGVHADLVRDVPLYRELAQHQLLT
ncbi:MAG: ABC transporter ATP-binding protein/permease [Actinobacteria bacterium]|nr:ABC transporter ATP-binding protein/permease [Actinomycetota bacterium]MBU1607727.1 ABC transporter ATP-binding protein/permease [Actinomycetota bacterium]MBU2316177.1 ABC transporter ATP-binding protein/permease [Actinomycetota bacterium]MBU2384629.1 ABC transporter ATP-binding protein/permease [Actinomycetota bacterium]